MNDTATGSDLLYGVPAIAHFLGLKDRQVYHLVSLGEIPTFKIGGKIAARRSGLAAWLAAKEAEA